MRSRALHLLAAAAAGIALSALATGRETRQTALGALRHSGELSCAPTLPHFCENMHVHCAGQTTVATFPFKLRFAPASNTVALLTQDEENRRNYADALSEWAQDGSYLLLSPPNAGGYVKLLGDGKYVFRHYTNGRGVMSLGHCR